MSTDEGVTLTETVVASALGMVLLAAVLATLVAGYRTQVFAQRQSEAVNQARDAMVQLQRDLQGAVGLLSDQSCPTTCLDLAVTSPTGSMQRVRHRLVGSELRRDIFDVQTGQYGNERVLADRLANLSLSPTVPLFTCSSSGALVSMKLSLVVRPAFRLNTTVRPRNFYQTAC